MAAVHGPLHPKVAHSQSVPRSRSSFNPGPPSNASQQTHTSSRPDPFYGHEYISRLCGRFITHLFACPEYPPQSTQSQAKLPFFIAYALHRTKLHSSVTFAALVLLQRLKARFPTARGSSGHRLFISAFMIASKVICDDTYSNKSWTIVAQGMFTLREINQMEREMCSYLEWELTVDNPILSNFEMMVKRDFRGLGPYPVYSLQMVSRRAARAAASTSATPIPPPHSTTSPIPMFGQHQASSPEKLVPAPQSAHHPTAPSFSSLPTTPDTPSPSHSTSTSPASSAPATPVGIEDLTAKIVGSPPFVIRRLDKNKMLPLHPLKGKMFAFAQPAVW